MRDDESEIRKSWDTSYHDVHIRTWYTDRDKHCVKFSCENTVMLDMSFKVSVVIQS